jgi:drug/metabolite transporter (DMT)-like permease
MKKGLLLVFSTAVVSGFSIYMNKFAVQGIDTNIFTFTRAFLIGMFLLSVILLFSGFKEFSSLKKKDWLKLSAIGLVGGSIPFLLYFRGLQLTSAASASLLHKTMFVYVMVFAIIFLKEKLDRKVIIAALLLLAGNYIMIRPSWAFNIGDLLIITATVFWAAENTLSKHVLKDLSGNMVAFGRMFFGSIFILIFLAATDSASLLLSLSSAQLNWILISAGMLLIYVMTWYNGLKEVNVSLATAILLLGSPITTLLNFASGSPMTSAQAFGGLLLVLGIVTFIISTPYINSLKWTKTRA